MSRRLIPRLAALLALGLVAADGPMPDAEGFVPLFDGKTLDGWIPVNVDPDTFTAKNGLIFSTGKPTGIMRTDRMYENFVLELEWRHLKPGGNAGLFVWSDGVIAKPTPFARSIEIQILDGHETPNYTSHGDVFAIHGATFKPDRPHPNGSMRCLPSEKRAKPSPEWNHYRVECDDGKVTLAVNGKVVSGGSESKPRKGYICLESEGGEVEFRSLRIKELPSTNPLPEEVATPASAEQQTLFDGKSLAGWAGDTERTWRVEEGAIVGGSLDETVPRNEFLSAEREYGDFELRLKYKLEGTEGFVNGGVQFRSTRVPDGHEMIGYQADLGMGHDGAIYDESRRKKFLARPSEEVLAKALRKDDWNAYRIRAEGPRIRLWLNDVLTADYSEPDRDIAAKGLISLQIHGGCKAVVRFKDIEIEELPAADPAAE